jgi:hypothetical protein
MLKASVFTNGRFFSNEEGAALSFEMLDLLQHALFRNVQLLTQTGDAQKLSACAVYKLLCCPNVIVGQLPAARSADLHQRFTTLQR